MQDKFALMTSLLLGAVTADMEYLKRVYPKLGKNSGNSDIDDEGDWLEWRRLIALRRAVTIMYINTSRFTS